MTAALATVTYLEPDQVVPDGYVGAPEFLTRAQITYRRLDYWTRTKRLRSAAANPGSGHRRIWPATEIPVAILTARLSDAGLDVTIAHDAARALLTTGHTTLAGIRIELPQEHP